VRALRSRVWQVDPGSVIAMAFILLGLYAAFTAAALLLPLWPPAARLLRASDADAVAVAMCAATKTVALGIPIIQAVYEDNPAAGLLSLPLIIYHAEQILFGSLLTAPLKRWLARRAARRAERAAAAAKEAADGQGSELRGVAVTSTGDDAADAAVSPPAPA
jgi:predicted Na+-dependent transporter